LLLYHTYHSQAALDIAAELSFRSCGEKRVIEDVALIGYSGVSYSLISAPELCMALLSVSSLFDENIFEEVGKL